MSLRGGTPPTTGPIVCDMLKHAGQVGHPPQDWTNAAGVGVPKNNGKEKCAAERPINSCGPAGNVTSRVAERQTPRHYQNNQYGGVPRRSVRDSPLVVGVVAWRVIHAGRSFMLSCYDVATAFPSMEWNPLFESVQKTPASPIARQASKILENIHRRMRLYMRTRDGKGIWLRRKKRSTRRVDRRARPFCKRVSRSHYTLGK